MIAEEKEQSTRGLLKRKSIRNRKTKKIILRRRKRVMKKSLLTREGKVLRKPERVMVAKKWVPTDKT